MEPPAGNVGYMREVGSGKESGAEKIKAVAPPITREAKEKNLKEIKEKITYDKKSVYAYAIGNVLDIISGVFVLPKKLQKTEIVIIELSKEYKAIYRPDLNKIFINYKFLQNGDIQTELLAILPHEIAHMLDNKIFGSGKGYGSEQMSMRKLMKVIESTESAKGLKKELTASQEELKKIELSDYRKLKNYEKKINKYEYLLEKKELLSRAIFQYFSQFDKKMLVYLNENVSVIEKFSEKDFVKISKQLEQMLRKAGLIK